MYCVRITLRAPTASFRIPEYHTFQQTLPLPPITTIRGILGAAGGLDCEGIQNYTKVNDIKMGVVGHSQGRYKDLWKYTKIKDKEVVKAVLTREYIYSLDLELYYACDNKDIINELQNWFLNPKYALSAGNSDDLAKILDVSQIAELDLVEANDFSNTILPGDHSDNYISNIDIEKAPIMRDIFVPQVYLLPSEFEFKGIERRVSQRKHYTFIDTPVLLKKPLSCIMMDGRSVALL